MIHICQIIRTGLHVILYTVGHSVVSVGVLGYAWTAKKVQSVETTSIQRWFNVLTLNQRWTDGVLTLWPARWLGAHEVVIASVFMYVLLFSAWIWLYSLNVIFSYVSSISVILLTTCEIFSDICKYAFLQFLCLLLLQYPRKAVSEDLNQPARMLDLRHSQMLREHHFAWNFSAVRLRYFLYLKIGCIINQLSNYYSYMCQTACIIPIQTKRWDFKHSDTFFSVWCIEYIKILADLGATFADSSSYYPFKQSNSQ